MSVKSFAPAIFAGAMFVFMPLFARASVVINVTQTGNNVTIAGSGSMNMTDLTYFQGGGLNACVQASDLFGNDLVLGSTNFTHYSIYSAFTASGNPFNGSSTVSTYAASGSGDQFGLASGTGEPNYLYVPTNYVSGAQLSATDIYTNTTIVGMGLIPGSYTDSWGTGIAADSLTLNIGTVPEPASLAVVGLPAALAMLRHRRSKMD